MFLKWITDYDDSHNILYMCISYAKYNYHILLLLLLPWLSLPLLPQFDETIYNSVTNEIT